MSKEEKVLAKVELLKKGIIELRNHTFRIEDHVNYLEKVDIKPLRPGSLKDISELTDTLDAIRGTLTQAKEFFDWKIPELQQLVRDIRQEYNELYRSIVASKK